MTASTQKPAPPLEIGAMVAEKYRIEALLGEGGMGFVFAALHVQLGHRVALKVLHSSAISDREVTERFLREGRALARLQGEHIARVSDVGTLPSGNPYMVMEFLEGQDLARELAARGPLPLHEAVEFVAQTCEALAEAHVRGIVHRDLKPANLFLCHKLDGDVSIKVLDFGISKVSSMTDGINVEAENITMTATLVGTPKYMSPEQIQDSRSVDWRTDIWGLGTIFYELLTQKRPFAAPTLALVCVKVLHEEVPAPSTIRPDLPPGIDAVIAKCLMKHPADRYANVGELVEALIPFGNPSVRASALRIQRILNASLRSSGPRLGPDSSGNTPGLLAITHTPSADILGADSGQPISRTPSAIRVEKEVATLTVGSPSMSDVAARSRRNRIVAIGGVALVIGVLSFLALRSPKSTETSVTTAASSEVPPASTPEVKPTPPVTATADPTLAPTNEPSATAATQSTKTHQWVRPPPVVVHHPTATATTATNTAPPPPPPPTQTAPPPPPKGTGDVLEDRR